MCVKRGSSYRRMVARALLPLALSAAFAGAAFAQTPGVAPLLTPPVQRVVPPPTPEVLPPEAPSVEPAEAVPPGRPVRIDDIRIEGVTVCVQAGLRSGYADMIGIAGSQSG